MDKKKTCPFCGGTALLVSTYSVKYRLYYTCCKCDMCGAQGKAFGGREDPSENDWDTEQCRRAIVAWNTRYTDENQE